MKRPRQTPADRILWTLVGCGGKADKSYLRRKMDMRLAEMESALAALESKKCIKRTAFEEKGKTNQMITLEGIPAPA